jgi:nitric oxide reductase NorD protein
MLAAWERRREASRPRTVRLDDVRRRLELLVTAVYDRPIPIATADRPRRTFGTRWTDPFGPRHLQRAQSLATTDGERIQLPAEIEAPDAETALTTYRLMAIEQAERIVRGTTAQIEQAATPLERDLYTCSARESWSTRRSPAPYRDYAPRSPSPAPWLLARDPRSAR